MMKQVGRGIDGKGGDEENLCSQSQPFGVIVTEHKSVD